MGAETKEEVERDRSKKGGLLSLALSSGESKPSHMNIEKSVRTKLKHLRAIAKRFSGYMPNDLHKGKITAAKPKTPPSPFNRDYRKKRRSPV